MKIETMTPEEVSNELREMGIRTSPSRVRAAIDQGAYPFGRCIEMAGKHYEIYRKLFEKWVSERAEER